MARAEVTARFAGLDLVPPGVAQLDRWQADQLPPSPTPPASPPTAPWAANPDPANNTSNAGLNQALFLSAIQPPPINAHVLN